MDITQASGAEDWRKGLRRELAWIVALKLAALGVLWALFFRGP